MAKTVTEDPRTKGPKPEPEFPQKPQSEPGTEAEMTPKADHGEGSYRGSDRLKDRVAVITGGDSGIGRAVALAFAREGADVVIAYLNEHEDARESERLVKEAGRRALLIDGDISERGKCEEIVERAFREFGRIDVLVNNAAYQPVKESIAEFTDDEFDRAMKTNVYAMFWICRSAVPRMKPGSAIINVASIQAYEPTPNLLPYSTTKGAIVTFTKGLAKMLAKEGIRVNAVAPGPVWTPLIPATLPAEKVKTFGSNTPMERPGQPAELAPAFVFLASNESSYITGEVIGVTGGRPLP
ncbi:MAG: SDR family oxidoreductase [Bryobacteraceae bacterium]|nr:SDR family oxidoreductase [Bryobacteraceae bacterium]